MVYPQPGFELMRDFAPISARRPHAAALVVNPSGSTCSTLAQFIEAARRMRRIDRHGVAGLATLQHLAIVMLQNRTGIELHHVPYRGGPPAMQDLLSGQVAGMFHSVGAVELLCDAGKLRALAVAGRAARRCCPTFRRWTKPASRTSAPRPGSACFAPRRTPEAILDRMHAAVQAALDSDEVKRVWVEQGAKVELESRADFTNFVDQEGRRWSGIVKAAGVEME
jgi:tripartite-type tricarboxylate transporter receptor subunit TctC